MELFSWTNFLHLFTINHTDTMNFTYYILNARGKTELFVCDLSCKILILLITNPFFKVRTVSIFSGVVNCIWKKKSKFNKNVEKSIQTMKTFFEKKVEKYHSLTKKMYNKHTLIWQPIAIFHGHITVIHKHLLFTVCISAAQWTIDFTAPCRASEFIIIGRCVWWTLALQLRRSAIFTDDYHTYIIFTEQWMNCCFPLGSFPSKSINLCTRSTFLFMEKKTNYLVW